MPIIICVVPFTKWTIALYLLWIKAWLIDKMQDRICMFVLLPQLEPKPSISPCVFSGQPPLFHVWKVDYDDLLQCYDIWVSPFRIIRVLVFNHFSCSCRLIRMMCFICKQRKPIFKEKSTERCSKLWLAVLIESQRWQKIWNL